MEYGDASRFAQVLFTETSRALAVPTCLWSQKYNRSGTTLTAGCHSFGLAPSSAAQLVLTETLEDIYPSVYAQVTM